MSPTNLITASAFSDNWVIFMGYIAYKYLCILLLDEICIDHPSAVSTVQLHVYKFLIVLLIRMQKLKLANYNLSLVYANKER